MTTFAIFSSFIKNTSPAHSLTHVRAHTHTVQTTNCTRESSGNPSQTQTHSLICTAKVFSLNFRTYFVHLFGAALLTSSIHPHMALSAATAR